MVTQHVPVQQVPPKPGGAYKLTLMTVALVALLGFAALMFGFFVTGWVGAALTWLVFGLVGAFILATWFATPRRDRV